MFMIVYTGLQQCTSDTLSGDIHVTSHPAVIQSSDRDSNLAERHIYIYADNLSL